MIIAEEDKHNTANKQVVDNAETIDLKFSIIAKWIALVFAILLASGGVAFGGLYAYDEWINPLISGNNSNAENDTKSYVTKDVSQNDASTTGVSDNSIPDNFKQFNCENVGTVLYAPNDWHMYQKTSSDGVIYCVISSKEIDMSSIDNVNDISFSDNNGRGVLITKMEHATDEFREYNDDITTTDVALFPLILMKSFANIGNSVDDVNTNDDIDASDEEALKSFGIYTVSMTDELKGCWTIVEAGEFKHTDENGNTFTSTNETSGYMLAIADSSNDIVYYLSYSVGDDDWSNLWDTEGKPIIESIKSVDGIEISKQIY